MITCLGKTCLFGLPCVYFVTVYNCVYASLLFGFDGGMWDLITLVPGLCLSFYFTIAL